MGIHTQLVQQVGMLLVEEHDKILLQTVLGVRRYLTLHMEITTRWKLPSSFLCNEHPLLFLGCFITVVLGALLELNEYELEKGLTAVVMLVIKTNVSVAEAYAGSLAGCGYHG